MAIQAAKPADSNSFDQLRTAASRVPGWTEQKEQYRFFTAKELYEIIDGGAVEYDKQGLKSGICVSLTSRDKSLEIYFEDFGSSSRAKGMVSIKKKSSSDPKKFSQVNVALAIYDEVIGGCVVYWAKGDYYIEMTLNGYDSLEKALRDAATLINSISPAIDKMYVHVISNSNGDSTVTKDAEKCSFNIEDFGDDDYRIVVEVQDAAGNTTVDSQEVYFNNGITNVTTLQEESIAIYAFNSIIQDKQTGYQLIHFQVPQASLVELTIFDMKGVLIKKIPASHLSSGRHTIIWTGKNNSGIRVNDGMYMCVLQSENFKSIKNLVYCR